MQLTREEQKVLAKEGIRLIENSLIDGRDPSEVEDPAETSALMTIVTTIHDVNLKKGTVTNHRHGFVIDDGEGYKVLVRIP